MSQVFKQSVKILLKNLFIFGASNKLMPMCFRFATVIPERNLGSSFFAETGSTASPSGGNLNSNAQAALMILLSAQQDSSILQNPQVVNVLQSLVAGSGQSGQDGSRQNAKTADLMSHPVLSSVLGQTTTAAASQQQSAPGLSQQAGNDPYGKRTALLGKPPSTAHPPPPTGSYPPSSSGLVTTFFFLLSHSW